jgi:hypothetical protein
MNQTYPEHTKLLKPTGHSKKAELFIRHDLLRLIHGGLIMHFPLAEVRQFWRENPLVVGGRRCDELETLRRLMSGGSKVSTESYCRTLVSCEDLCARNDVPLESFVDFIFNRLEHGNALPGSVLLRFIVPAMHWITGEGDIRKMGVRMGSRSIKISTKQGLFEVVGGMEDENYYTDIILFHFDSSFSTHFSPFDASVWMGMKVKYSPCFFGAPPFEEVKMISEQRTIDETLPSDHTLRSADDLLYLNDKPLARKISFKSFLDKWNIDFRKYPVPSMLPVYEMLVDYHCPIQKRVVLQKGSVYGAPVPLMYVRYRKLTTLEPHTIVKKTVIHGTTNKSIWSEIEKKHHDLIEQMKQPFHFTFESGNDRMLVNGKVLIKGVPARILNLMLKSKVDEGKTVFERREFLYNDDIVTDRYNTGFELRLQRLTAALSRKCSAIRINRIARGAYQLQVEGEFTYEEILPLN